MGTVQHASLTDTAGGLHNPKGMAAADPGHFPRKALTGGGIEWVDIEAGDFNPHLAIGSSATGLSPNIAVAGSYYSLSSIAWEPTLLDADGFVTGAAVAGTEGGIYAVNVSGLGHYMAYLGITFTATADDYYRASIAVGNSMAELVDANTIKVGITEHDPNGAARPTVTLNCTYYVKLDTLGDMACPMMTSGATGTFVVKQLRLVLHRIHKTE